MWLTWDGKEFWFDKSEVKYVRQSKTEPSDVPCRLVQRPKGKSDFWAVYEAI